MKIEIKIPKTEKQLIEFIRKTGIIGLSLSVLYILFSVLIAGTVTVSEPNRIVLFIEIGLVSGILGSAFIDSEKLDRGAE